MSTANSVIAQLQSDLQFANETTGASDTTIHDAITTLASGFGGGKLEDFIPEEAFYVTGNCSYRFGEKFLDWFLERYADRITTSDITDATRMFIHSEVENIPFDLNFADGGCSVAYLFGTCKKLKSVPDIDFKQTSAKTCNDIFSYCSKLKEIGKLSNLFPSRTDNLFNSCYDLRYLPVFENLDLSYMQTSTTSNANRMFAYCLSLREVPSDLLNNLYTRHANGSYTHMVSMFENCYALNEIKGLNPQTATFSSNIFRNTFDNNSRVKNIVFATQDDNLPYLMNCRTQTIDLTKNVGYGTSASITGYNSGITEDKQVTDYATYQALKNDPDWFTTDVNYSRYNHDSAVNTINSLPDTSAYLATAGGTNTIKFTGQSGALTDGGAINTLTEAEIAVATAKGWTVTFV